MTSRWRSCWTPSTGRRSFITWELAGKFPRILEDEVVGAQASELYRDAQAMLQRIIDEKLLDREGDRRVLARGAGRCGRYHVYADESRTSLGHPAPPATTDGKAQRQAQSQPGRLHRARDSGVTDYIGGFCVTTGHGVDELAAQFEAEHDDYSSIMLKALADRLAESFAEHLHRLVRTELWGYDPRKR